MRHDMYQFRPFIRTAWCRKPLLLPGRRFISAQQAQQAQPSKAHEYQSLPAGWEDQEATLSDFTELPHKDFGKNQLIQTNEE